MSRRRWFDSIAAGGGLAGRCRRARNSASSVGHGPCSAIRSCKVGSRAARPVVGVAFILAHHQPSDGLVLCLRSDLRPKCTASRSRAGLGRVRVGLVRPWPEARGSWLYRALAAIGRSASASPSSSRSGGGVGEIQHVTPPLAVRGLRSMARVCRIAKRDDHAGVI